MVVTLNGMEFRIDAEDKEAIQDICRQMPVADLLQFCLGSLVAATEGQRILKERSLDLWLKFDAAIMQR